MQDKQANKMYYKGMKGSAMIDRLNMDKVQQAIRTELEPLYKELGI